MKPTLVLLTALLLAPLKVLHAADAPPAPMQHPLEVSAAVAMANGQSEIRLPVGTVILERGLTFKGLRNLVIDGTETKLVCRDWRHTALNFEDCSSITLRGVTIDYDPLPFTQGTVTARAEDGAWIEVAIHDAYRDYDEGFREGRL